MGLFVSTTGTDVEIPELGITIVDPTVDFEVSAQFNGDEIRASDTLTNNIRNGTLAWKKTGGGSLQPALDYDKDFVGIDQENTGPGLSDDRTVTFKDLLSSTIPTKAGTVPFASFTGSPRKATVTFTNPFSGANYAVIITGGDGRTWTIESKLAGSFVINSNANQPLTTDTDWVAILIGETQ